MSMKPEILLKAFVQYESEDAFRELVGSTLDEVYSLALRIVQGPQHLAEETVLRVYWELARKAPRLGEDVVLGSWLREHTCKMAVIVLHEEDRSVDRRYPVDQSAHHLRSLARTNQGFPGTRHLFWASIYKSV